MKYNKYRKSYIHDNICGLYLYFKLLCVMFVVVINHNNIQIIIILLNNIYIY